MSELIDREALMKYPIRINHYDKEHGNKHFVLGIESVLEFAENLPTIDAVEVVWKSVQGYEGYYEVSALGQVRGRHRIISVDDNCKNPDSYGTICVKCNMCGRFDKPKETNADRIRAMSDEELQKFLLEFEAGDIDYAKTFCDLCCKDAALERKSTDCDGCLLWWLQHNADQPQGLNYWKQEEHHEH